MFELPFCYGFFLKLSLNWFNRSDDIIARKWLIQSVGQIFEVLLRTIYSYLKLHFQMNVFDL